VLWSEKYWENSDQFISEQFLKSNNKLHPFSYISFSAGARNCIGKFPFYLLLILKGQRFVLQKATVIFSMMLQQFSVVHHDVKNLCLVLSPTLVPEGLSIKFLPRAG
jgi:cytochrome P450